MLVGEVRCVCPGPAGIHKPSLLCAAPHWTCTRIPLAHGPQTLFSSAQAPTPVGALLRAALPLHHPPVLFLATATSQACLHPAGCPAALARSLDLPDEHQNRTVTVHLSDDQHCQGTCPCHHPCPAPVAWCGGGTMPHLCLGPTSAAISPPIRDRPCPSCSLTGQQVTKSSSRAVFLKTFIDKCHIMYSLENSNVNTVLHTVYKTPNIFMCFSGKTH